MTGDYDDDGYFEVSTGDLVSANYGLTIKGSNNPNACSVDWKVYVNSSPSIASFESVEKKCPNEKAEFIINGIKKVDKLELAYYRNEGGKLVEDKTLRENVPGFTSEGGKWYITNIANDVAGWLNDNGYNTAFDAFKDWDNLDADAQSTLVACYGYERPMA